MTEFLNGLLVGAAIGCVASAILVVVLVWAILGIPSNPYRRKNDRAK